jgi:uroporphyrinogen-III decarboxylase
MMTPKERLLTALNREKPDRLPVTVHQWQGYHLDKFMGGISDLEACIKMGFDAQIQLDKKLQFIDSMKGARFDLIETGGGSASSTLISPALHKEFCLPYDRKMHNALHDLGFKITYHTCGGTAGIEEMIIQNGCDASETLAPPSIGGNQEPWVFAEKIKNRIALIGGADQVHVITDGDRELICSVVQNLFGTVGKNGGYICSLSDHFFETPLQKLQWYAEAAHQCRY